MDTNWRSTEAVINAYNRLFWGAPLHQAASDIFKFGITYEQINPTPEAVACKKPLIEIILFSNNDLDFDASLNIYGTKFAYSSNKNEMISKINLLLYDFS